MIYKIINLPTAVGGNPIGLSTSLSMLGAYSVSWILRPHKFCYPADKTLTKKSDHILIFEIKRFFALRYIFLFNVVIFNFGKTLYSPIPYKDLSYKGHYLLNYIFRYFHFYYCLLMQLLELSLLRIFKRKVLIFYQGDDARLGCYIEQFPISLKTEVKYYTKSSDIFKKEQINRIKKYTHKTYSLNPDLLHTLPKESSFIPYSHVPLKSFTININKNFKNVTIGHAPSDRNVKGTSYIIQAVQDLQNEGHLFQFLLIENLSHKSALKEYSKCNVLIDQLFAGWYGGLALECMAMSIPVVSYIRQEDLVHIPPDMCKELPIINANKYTINKVIKDILSWNNAEYQNHCLRSFEFAKKWHNPMVIANKIIDDINNI